jgi:hypothetical protein
MLICAGDMSKAVYRHLAEQKWRNEGDLDLLVSFLAFYALIFADTLFT